MTPHQALAALAGLTAAAASALMDPQHLAAVPTVPISPGIRLPYIALGTGSGMLRPGSNVTAAVQLWLSVGGSAIDTAFDYHDESAIAKGIAASSAPAPFIITKIPCSTYAEAAANIDSNLAQLGMESTSLLLIHFPQCAGLGSTAETWRAMEDAQAVGKARVIGVSNFGIAELEDLRQSARKWPPAVNQCSLSVGFHDDPTIEYCAMHGITYMAYSPLCGGANGSSCRHGGVLGLPQVQSVASAHNVSTAQVALKWIVQQGHPLATAVWRRDYMEQDLDLWSWGDLSKEEMSLLTAV